MTHKLPVGDIFIAALALPFQHYKKLLILGIPIFIMGFLCVVYFPSDFTLGDSTVSIALVALLSVLTLVSLLIAIVGCHRLFLMKDDEVKASPPMLWSGNEMHYLGWWLLMSVFIFVIMIPFVLAIVPFMTVIEQAYLGEGLLADISINIFIIPLYYLISRWSLVLPAVATDKRGLDLSWAWKLSKGNAWRLTLLIGFFPFIKDIAFSLIPATESVLFNLVDGFLWLVVGVIEVGLLSLSYEFLIKHQATEEQETSSTNPELVS